jgi:putative transposase
MARENSGWGYDRIVGAMANLGYTLSDQTVGNILQRHGISAAPIRERTTTWADFIRTQLSVLAGTDFFSRCVGWSLIMSYSLSISKAAKLRLLE